MYFVAQWSSEDIEQEYKLVLSHRVNGPSSQPQT